MTAYYNEFDPFAAAWLRELIKDGLIADDTSMSGALPKYSQATLPGFDKFISSQVLAAGPTPCDLPESTTTNQSGPDHVRANHSRRLGKRKGVADERHLWPEMFRLVRECRPATVFGEQVASKDGREWLAGVFTDLETMGYAAAGADLCAAGVSSPHIRQRLYWVANSKMHSERTGLQPTQQASGRRDNDRRCSDENRIDRTRDATGEGSQRKWREYSSGGKRSSGLTGFAMQDGVPDWNGPTIGIKCSDGTRRASAEPESFPLAYGVSNRVGTLRGAGNAIVPQVAAEFIKAFYETTAK